MPTVRNADPARVVHEPLELQLPPLPTPAARAALTAAGTDPSACTGVHASLGTHCEPQPAQASIATSYDATTRPQSHS